MKLLKESESTHTQLSQPRSKSRKQYIYHDIEESHHHPPYPRYLKVFVHFLFVLVIGALSATGLTVVNFPIEKHSVEPRNEKQVCPTRTRAPRPPLLRNSRCIKFAYNLPTLDTIDHIPSCWVMNGWRHITKLGTDLSLRQASCTY